MANDSVGVAVVGTSFGCLTHVRALRAAGFDVLALVGRDPDRTAQRAERFGIPHAKTSLGAALDLSGVEAVTIATPPNTHGPLVLECIAAGRHVLCEKPLARDADEAGALLDAAESAGIVHLVGTEFRWAAGPALAARTIRAGAIGQPRLATFLLHIPMLADPMGALPSWWADDRAGGGWLGAQASHTIDQIRVTLGEFDGVSATLNVVSDRAMTAEDSYGVLFHLRSGVDGVMQSTAGAWGPPLFISRIAGSTGTLMIDGDVVSIADRDGTHRVPVPEDLVLEAPSPPPSDLLVSAYDQLHAFGIDLAPYTRLVRAFGDLIRGRPVADDPRPATFADGLAGMVVLDGIRRSSRSRAWVRIAAGRE